MLTAMCKKTLRNKIENAPSNVVLTGVASLGIKQIDDRLTYALLCSPIVIQ